MEEKSKTTPKLVLPQEEDSDPLLRVRAFHRITESQNVRGWKGPLWVI